MECHHCPRTSVEVPELRALTELGVIRDVTRDSDGFWGHEPSLDPVPSITERTETVYVFFACLLFFSSPALLLRTAIILFSVSITEKKKKRRKSKKGVNYDRNLSLAIKRLC